MNSLRRYLAFWAWFIPDSLWRFKGASALVFVTGFLGVAFHVQAAALAVTYAKSVSSGAPFSLSRIGLDWSYAPRTSIALLSMACVGILVSFIAAAVCIFISRRGSVKLNRHYNELCTRRALEILSGNAFAVSGLEGYEVGSDKYFQRLAVADSKQCGRVLRLVLGITIPSISLCFSLLVLVYLEPLLTILVLLCVAMVVYCQQWISHRAAKHSILYERYTSEAARSVGRYVRGCKNICMRDCADGDRIDALINSDSFQKYLDSYEVRIRAVDESHLVSGVAMGAILALVLLFMGGGIIEQEAGWGRLLVYLVAVRVAMSNLHSVFGLLTSINRFFPQVNRYGLFIQSVERKCGPSCSLVPGYELRGGGVLGSTEGGGALRPGMALAAVSGLPLDRYTASFMLSELLAHADADPACEVGSMRLVTFDAAWPGDELLDMPGIRAGASWSGIGLPASMGARLEKRYPGWTSQGLDVASWPELDRRIRFALALLAGAASGARWLFVEERGARMLGGDFFTSLANYARNAIVVVVSKGGEQEVGDFGERTVAVFARDRLADVGSVEWFNSVRSLVARMVLKDEKVHFVGEDDDDDDLDDEM